MITFNSPIKEISQKELIQLYEAGVCLNPECKGEYLVESRSGIECQKCGVVYRVKPYVKKKSLSSYYAKHYTDKKHSYK